MKKISKATILFFAVVGLSNMAAAKASTNDPTPQEKRICFKFLKTQDVAPEGYQVASSASYAFAHSTRRGGQLEYIFQVEVAKDDGSAQKFVFVTVNEECNSVLSVSAPTEN